MTSQDSLARTPLYEAHRRAGARLVPFAGWEMPVQYSGVMDEHRAVRTAAGLFDVSHMGEIRVAGPDAEAFLQGLTPNDVSKLAEGRAHYSGLLTEEGTYIDDLLVYRLGEEEFLLVVNAANREADAAWVRERATGAVEVADVSGDYALLALQGPAAMGILADLTSFDAAALRYYAFGHGEVAGKGALISRTGYTGEDGVELYVAPGDAEAVWDALLAAGSERGLVPAGLGARDTLRLEAAMALYGHELDRETTPWEAGLDWVVKMGKGDFVGRAALERQKQSGVPRKLVGFEVADRGIARQGHAVIVDDEVVGEVTSGTFSPTFEKALGMAWVPTRLAEPGREIAIDVRGRRLPARLVETPFYKRPR
ncbi:MAG: glycine cleavage system aminomethyltransferase GcvT [Thermoanaerobaculia bacterium]